MKLKGVLAALFVGLVFFSHQALSDTLGGPREYGPYECGDCAVGYPAPDPVTKSIIKWAEDRYAPVLIGFSPGDTIMVCSATVCVTYKVSADDKYFGVKREVQTPPPTGGTGGGGGGGGGGHGGTPGGGGSSGSVKVGDVEQVKK